MNDKLCRKCGGEMKRGKAICQTAVARRRSRGPDDMRTFYWGGTGKLIDCLKCSACGWSVTATEAALQTMADEAQALDLGYGSGDGNRAHPA